MAFTWERSRAVDELASRISLKDVSTCSQYEGHSSLQIISYLFTLCAPSFAVLVLPPTPFPYLPSLPHSTQNESVDIYSIEARDSNWPWMT